MRLLEVFCSRFVMAHCNMPSLGTVPVYLGDSSHLKTLLPHPSAAIFVSDFGDNITALADYVRLILSLIFLFAHSYCV
jgi:hypothetical protein